MSVGLVPINQQNALPLYSPLSGAEGGLLTLVGGNLTRFWASTQLGGLSGAGWVTRGAQLNLESSTLDWRGVSRFSLVVNIANATGVAVTAGWGVYIVHGLAGGALPLVDANKAQLILAGTFNVTSLANGASIVRNMDWAVTGQYGITAAAGFAGGYWQVVINTTSAAASTAGVSMTPELWAGS